MALESDCLPILELPDAASAFRVAAQLRREGFSAYPRARGIEDADPGSSEAPQSPSFEVVVSREDYEDALAWCRRGKATAGVLVTPAVEVSGAPNAPRAAGGLDDRSLSWEVAAVLLVFVVPPIFTAVADYFAAGDLWKSLPDSISSDLWTVLVCLGQAAVLLYLIRRSREPAARFGWTRPRWRWDIPIVLGLLGLLAWAGWFFELPWIEDTDSSSLGGIPPEAAWPLTRLDWTIVVLECVVVGFSEELLFRGYLFTRIERLTRSTDGSWLMTSILFGLVHLYGGWGHVLYTTFLGAAFGLVFCVTRRLWPIAIAHAANNLLTYAFAYAFA